MNILNNALLDNMLQNNIINYLNKPVKVYDHDYDSTKLVRFYNKQKIKREKLYKKYKYIFCCIYIILVYVLFCI